MGLTIGPTGKLMTLNGKLFIDDNGMDCCCGDAENCCDILVDFAELIVSGQLEGTPIGTPGGGWHGNTNPGTGAEFSSVDDFHIYCEEATEFYGGRFRIELSISSSAPCEYTTVVYVDWPSPCCPLSIDVELTDLPELCQTGGTLSFHIATPGSIPCPT